MFENYVVSQNGERENVIYGAGAFGRRFLYFLSDLDIPVHCFCQTEAAESSMKIEGIPVVSFEDLKKYGTNKNIFIALSDKMVSRQIRQTLQIAFGETAHIYECGNFIDINLKYVKGKHYCCLCGNYFDKYEPGGSDFEIFKKNHIIGGGFRKNYRCPCCGAVDRERWIYMVLSEETGIYVEPCRVLHFAPEDKIMEIIKWNQRCDYYDADIEVGRARHVIDMTNIPFQDNTFDYIIANHILEHIKKEDKAISELKRVLRKDGKIILSFPICKNKKTEEDLTELSEQEKISRFGQSDHVRLYGTDYRERLEVRGFRCSCYSPGDSLSVEQIEKYGLIQEDVCIICEK